MICSRRRLLGWGGALTAGAMTGSVRAAPSTHLALYNVHTEASLEVQYRRAGVLVDGALDAVQNFLRDFRTGDVHAIDPALLDQLVAVARLLGVDASFSVISGYRSPLTNRLLRERGGGGVATHSLHMEGRAIDVRLARVNCAELAARSLQLRQGGVGYYRASDFVHLDTGALRSWKG